MKCSFKLLLLKVISKAICDPVFVTRISVGDKKVIYINGEVLFQCLKTLVVMRCSTLSSVRRQFISFNSLAPICCLELSFKQKRRHLF